MEKLEFIKSFKNKLNKSFVDSFQRYDLYHKLNIYLNHYNKFQIKAYLRNNLILNLIFIQKFKEFKYYNNHFYLNLNLLPTTYTQYVNSLIIELYKESINYNLLILYNINKIITSLSAQQSDSCAANANANAKLFSRQGPGVEVNCEDEVLLVVWNPCSALHMCSSLRQTDRHCCRK